MPQSASAAVLLGELPPQQRPMTHMITRRRRPVAIALVAAVGAAGGIYGFAREGTAARTETGAHASYARLATAPPLRSAGVSPSPELSAMARRAQIDPAGLRQVMPGDAGHGAVVSGRNAVGS